MSAARKVVCRIGLILGAVDPFKPVVCCTIRSLACTACPHFREVTPVFSCLPRLMYVLHSWGQHGSSHLLLGDCMLPASVEIVAFHGARFRVPLGPCKSNSADHFVRS